MGEILSCINKMRNQTNVILFSTKSPEAADPLTTFKKKLYIKLIQTYICLL